MHQASVSPNSRALSLDLYRASLSTQPLARFCIFNCTNVKTEARLVESFHCTLEGHRQAFFGLSPSRPAPQLRVQKRCNRLAKKARRKVSNLDKIVPPSKGLGILSRIWRIGPEAVRTYSQVGGYLFFISFLELQIELQDPTRKSQSKTDTRAIVTYISKAHAS